MFAAAKRDSAMRLGSYAFQSFLSKSALGLCSSISFCTYKETWIVIQKKRYNEEYNVYY
jgi:hypothetical protein